MATSMAENEKMGWPRRNLHPGHDNSGERHAVAAVAWRRRCHTSDLTPQRFLTGAEAAARAEQFIRTTFEERALESGIDLSKVTTSCETEDFNARTKKWIVRCTFAAPSNLRFQVDDATGEVGGIALATKTR